MFSCKFQISSDSLTDLDNFIEEIELDNVSIFENTEAGFTDKLDEHGFPVAKLFDIEIFTENANLVKNVFDRRFGESIKFIDISDVAEKDWVASYLKELKPVICDKFYFYNEFTQSIPENQKFIPIKLNSALAFGSGHHQTTKACLLNMLWLSEHISSSPKNILDMGCGTGILGICALKIWEGAQLLGIDVDEDAVNITQSNYISNDINAEAIVGENLQNIDNKFDIIFCNILKQPLITLCSEFAVAMRPDAHIITSGYINSQEPEIIEHYATNGFDIVNRIQLDDWVSVMFKRACVQN